MAEQIEEQQQEEVVSAGDGGKGKSGEQIAADNRLNLYNQILNLKEPGFSDVYKKAGYKKFDALLKDNQDFQGELLNDLIDRGFKIDPENFSAAYTNIKPVNVYNMPEEAVPAPPPVPKDTEDDGIFSQLKGMAKNFYDVTKTAVQNPLIALKFLNPFSDLNPLNVVRKEQAESLGKYAKRGYYTGVAGQGAQAEDFARGKVDTKNLAKYLKKAHELGATQLEAEFAKDEGFLKDSQDMALILVPSILESFANMFGAGYKKIIGATAAGAGAGAAYGSVAPGAGTAAGALAGGSRALQYSMLQQGYNLEFVGTIIDELTQKKLINMDADEKTLEKQLNDAFANKELMAPIFKKANTRAASITGVDWVFGGMGNATMRTLAKSKVLGKALQTPAGKVIAQVAEATVSNPVYKRAAILANRVAQIDRKIGKSAVGRAGATMGVADMMGGAVGEGLAQSLTQDNLDWKALTVEGLAEGKFINTLRALGDIGDKRNVEAAARNIAEGKPADDGDVEFVAVTDEEYNNYKKGKVDPERAAGIRDDLDIALGNANHLNKLEAADPLYGKMVKDAYDKVIRAFENQKLYNLAINEIADLHGMTEQETRDSITSSSPGFNQKISDDFKNTLSVLQQQYKQETGDDSKDTTRVSGEVGGGAESQQAESQQRASEEEAGNDRVVQEAADEQRLKEIDDLLSYFDDFFNQSGDRLLSPEERQDLEQERAGLTTAAGTTTQQTGVGNAPTQEGTQQTGGVSPQPASTEVVGNTGVAAAPQGETTEQPAVTTETAVGETVPAAGVVATETGTTKRGKKAAGTAATATTTTETKTEEKPAPKEIKPSDVEIRKGKTHEQDGIYEAVYKGKVIGKMSFDKKEKVWVDASGDKFAQKKDVVDKMVLQYNMKNEAAAETTTAKGEGKGNAAPTGKAESAPTTETKGETKPTGKAEPAPTAKNEPAGSAMPSSIQEAYSRRATLRMTAEALQKQMGGKKLSPKAQKELDTVNAEIAKLDNLLNTFEKEREKQRAAKAKAEQTSEKKETKTEEKPTTLVGGTLLSRGYGMYLIDKLVAIDPKGVLNGIKAKQGYIDAWNSIAKTHEDSNKANSFLEDILVGMMPADKKPTAYADIREGFKKWQAGETTTETKGETKPAEKTETKEQSPAPTTKALPSFSEFDAISADRGKMKEAKAEFIAKHGQLAYDAMKEISANFTKITKALQEKEILTKKC